MTDDLDALKAALKAATPAPDAAVRETTLRLALQNFDRLQGSTAGPRPSEDRPVKAGFMQGLVQMIQKFTTRQMLAGTASAAAVVVGIVAMGPMLMRGPDVARDVPKAIAAPPAPAPASSAAMAAETGGTVVADAPAATMAETPVDPAPVAAPPAPSVVAEGPPAEPILEEMAREEEPAAAALAQPQAEGAESNTATIPGQGVAISGTERMGIVYDGEADALASQPAAPAPLAARRTVSADGVIAEGEFSPPPTASTESFATAAANPVKVTAEEPVSTFSIDVDTASYAVIRQSINAGQLPPADAVRVEEMLNYFPYAYPAPAADAAPFQPTVTVMPTPWNFGTRLVHVSLQGEMPAIDTRPPLNLVFLIDTSGSMNEPTKLPLLQKALALMLGSLRPGDQVAIVAYAGSAGLVLDATDATDTDAIYAAIDRLAAGGSTAGAEGLELAYQTAARMTADGEVSRVLLATDGDFNVGISDPAALTDYIAAQRDTGIYLSVLGFGRGNLDDSVMQALAQNGNGQAAYIDTLSEARKVLVDQVAGALFPIANDVKIQIEWNPAQVAEYRLIGYETRALARSDFNNDRVDAGEIGAGLQVTAIYEVTAPGSTALLNDPLRYGTATAAPDAGSEMGFLRLRYKEPGGATSQLIEVPIVPGETAPSDDVRFAAAVAGFGQLLTGVQYLGEWGWDDAIALANGARGTDDFGYRIEAVNLMRLAKELTR
jgi:Ca-activated chloride channel homolog